MEVKPPIDVVNFNPQLDLNTELLILQSVKEITDQMNNNLIISCYIGVIFCLIIIAIILYVYFKDKIIVQKLKYFDKKEFKKDEH